MSACVVYSDNGLSPRFTGLPSAGTPTWQQNTWGCQENTRCSLPHSVLPLLRVFRRAGTQQTHTESEIP